MGDLSKKYKIKQINLVKLKKYLLKLQKNGK